MNTTNEFDDFSQKVKDEGLRKEVLAFFMEYYNSQPRNEKSRYYIEKVKDVIDDFK